MAWGSGRDEGLAKNSSVASSAASQRSSSNSIVLPSNGGIHRLDVISVVSSEGSCPLACSIESKEKVVPNGRGSSKMARSSSSMEVLVSSCSTTLGSVSGSGTEFGSFGRSSSHAAS